MHRRRYLAVVAASLAGTAGCLGGAGGGDAADGESFPTVTAAGDDVAADRDAALTVGVEDGFGESSPAALRIAYENVGDAEREVTFAVSPPFPPYAGERTDGDGRLTIVPSFREHVDPQPAPEDGGDDPFVPAAPADGCWRARASVAGEDIGLTRTVGPGETVAETYSLLAHPDSESCLAAGSYRFEDPRYFGADEPWGFEVTLER